MNFAAYTRKSVFSDKSDSVKNQARMCQDYADSHFPGKVDSFRVYQDEDCTGANTNRPGLKKLLSDVEDGQIDVLVVYQLDRLSRNVRDFSNLYSYLEEHGVQFISVKENIDTTTPIGKAMMYVSVVFAQMERETTASRVYDNMIGLSDSGWWVGGNPPYPYVRKNATLPDGKKHVTLELESEEAASWLQDFFQTFLDNGFSLQRYETWLRSHGIFTRNGKFFQTTQIYKLLTMPFCVEGTAAIYDFYAAKGCIMSPGSPRELWDGSHGVMIYGRTTERNGKHQLVPPEKWRVCLGRHAPCVSADTWLAVQAQFTHNVFEKKLRHSLPLLKGTLRCSCGRLMSLSRKAHVDGSVATWYMCPRRGRFGKDACSVRSIRTTVLDEKVLSIFSEIEQDPDAIYKYAQEPVPAVDYSVEERKLQKRLDSISVKIGNLTSALAEGQDGAAAKYILSAIQSLDEEKLSVSRKLSAVHQESRNSVIFLRTLEEKRSEISGFIRNIDNFNEEERNEIARNCIESAVWDGETLTITL